MTKSLTIPLSDRRPVTIDPDEWPLLAETSWTSDDDLTRWLGDVIATAIGDRVDSSAREWIRVRQHADGRAIVYGCHDEGPHAHTPGFLPIRAGFLLRPPLADFDDIVRAIRRVGGIVCQGQEGDLAARCIATLPAETA